MWCGNRKRGSLGDPRCALASGCSYLASSLAAVGVADVDRIRSPVDMRNLCRTCQGSVQPATVDNTSGILAVRIIQLPTDVLPTRTGIDVHLLEAADANLPPAEVLPSRRRKTEPAGSSVSGRDTEVEEPTLRVRTLIEARLGARTSQKAEQYTEKGIFELMEHGKPLPVMLYLRQSKVN